MIQLTANEATAILNLSRQWTVRLGPCGAWSILRRWSARDCSHDPERERLYGQFVAHLSKVALRELETHGATIHAARLRIIDAGSGRSDVSPPYSVHLEWFIESEMPESIARGLIQDACLSIGSVSDLAARINVDSTQIRIRSSAEWLMHC